MESFDSSSDHVSGERSDLAPTDTPVTGEEWKDIAGNNIHDPDNYLSHVSFSSRRIAQGTLLEAQADIVMGSTPQIIEAPERLVEHEGNQVPQETYQEEIRVQQSTLQERLIERGFSKEEIESTPGWKEGYPNQ